MKASADDKIPLPRSPRQFHDSADGGAEFIATMTAETKNWHNIPLLNYTPINKLKDQSVVRFRGMIQDMADPEMYYEHYEVRSDKGETCVRRGKYLDVLSIDDGEDLDTTSPETKRGTRRTFFLVSVPGLNNWVHDYEAECNQSNIAEPLEKTSDTATGSSSKKRPAEQNEPNKRLRVYDDAPSSSCAMPVAVPPVVSSLSDEYLLNSPIPERPSKACMARIYDDCENYKLNSLVDVVGFLSVDPKLNITSMANPSDYDCDNVDEMCALYPPPSLIPRLHVIVIHVLKHANPLLDLRFLPFSQEEFDAGSLRHVHKELRTLLTMVLCNDELAADYLFSHLISNVYSRKNMESIGKFTLNLINVSDEIMENYTKEIYKILELLLVSSHYYPMTLDKLNTDTFLPKKDYATNKLVSGQLQLAPYTHLVLDETKMQQGTLGASGVAAVQSFADLIKHQHIQIDYKFYNINYEVDVPVLVLSEGRSMLPCSFVVPLKIEGQEKTFISETLKAAYHYLDAERLVKFRRFITLAKFGKYGLDAEQSTKIENEYVEMRRLNIVDDSEDLHALLVLSRLLGIARGGQLFDIEMWDLAKKMEAERKQRVAALPKSRMDSL